MVALVKIQMQFKVKMAAEKQAQVKIIMLYKMKIFAKILTFLKIKNRFKFRRLYAGKHS